MNCKICFANLLPNSKFSSICDECGKEFDEEIAVKFELEKELDAAAAYDETQEEILIVGRGQDSFSSTGWFLLGLTGAGLSLYFAFTFGTYEVPWGWTGHSVRTEYNEFFYVFIVLSVLSIIDGFIAYFAVAGTKIEVYENEVHATGISRFFYLGIGKKYNLKYSIDKVSATATDRCIIIGEHGAPHYRVYAGNPKEIQDVIFAEKEKLQKEKASTAKIYGTKRIDSVTCACGQANPKGYKFCNGCGVKSEKVCPCGHINPDGYKFCNNCGKSSNT